MGLGGCRGEGRGVLREGGRCAGGAEAETLCAALTDEACPPRAQPAAAFIRKNSPTRAASANAPSSARKA